jgi:hypothetical protein
LELDKVRTSSLASNFFPHEDDDIRQTKQAEAVTLSQRENKGSSNTMHSLDLQPAVCSICCNQSMAIVEA